MKKIVVALDGSDASEAALTYAEELARRIDASLILVFVVQPTFVAPDAAGMDMLYVDGLRKTGTEILEKTAARLTAAGIACQTAIQFGSPADAIAKLAKAEGAWLVVSGSHGYGVLARTFLGSVASRLVNVSEVPVLVVKQPPAKS